MLDYKNSEMYADAIQALRETLEEGYSDCVNDLHNTAFNTDFYVCYYQEAVYTLNDVSEDTSKIIQYIKSYEKGNPDERYAGFSNPVEVCNNLFCIIGKEILQELATVQDNWYEDVDSNLRHDILDELDSIDPNMVPQF
ncbi:MAG: hypothetical protein Q4F79_12540 [Eubacteriales bacterium]|nr:hypothetical protein [Eubacteriales bacterium]